MAVLEAKAADYLSKRIRLRTNLDQVGLAIPKTGDVLSDTTGEQMPGQSVVEVTRANHQVYYQRLQVWGWRLPVGSTIGRSTMRRSFSRT